MSGFKLKMITVIVMLALGFVGVILTDISHDGAWQYWRYLSIVYALISLALSFHLKRKGWRNTVLTLWHEIGHWAGLIGAIFICSYFVSAGLVGRFEASLVMLLLLALATYLAGVYIEPFFILLGIALGAFAAGLAFVGEYLYNLLLPILIIVTLLLILFFHHRHKKNSI